MHSLPVMGGTPLRMPCSLVERQLWLWMWLLLLPPPPPLLLLRLLLRKSAQLDDLELLNY